MMEKKNVDTEAGVKNHEAATNLGEGSKQTNRKKAVVLGIIAFVCCAGIIIGLSVALTTNKNNDDNNNDNNTRGNKPKGPKPNPPPGPPAGPAKPSEAILTDGIIQSAPYHKLSFSLRTFGSSSIDAYESCSALEEDLKSAASIYLESVIARNVESANFGNNPPILGSPPILEDSNNNKVRPDGSNPDDSYGTNNQVKGVDEADVVKSNGKHVFAVYGSEIVVWDAESGDVLSRTDHANTRPPAMAPTPTSSYRPPSSSSTRPPAMAPTPTSSYRPPSSSNTRPPAMAPTPTSSYRPPSSSNTRPPAMAPTPTSSYRPPSSSNTRPPAMAPTPTSSYRPPSSSSTRPPMAPSTRRLSMIAPGPSVTVNSLLLHKNRLTAIVTKYGDSTATSPQPEMRYNMRTTTSQIIIYNITEIPTDGNSALQEVFKKEINGTFIEARSIENYAHIVTSTDTSIFSLSMSISPYRGDFRGLTKDEYLAKVKPYIEEKQIIENFVNNTLEMITNNDNNDCSHVVKLALFQSSDSNATLPLSMWSSGTIGSYGQITTLDMLMDTDGGSRRLNNANTVTGFFLPNSYDTKVYASQNHMVIATSGNSFSNETSTWVQYTFFRTFTLSNDGTRAQGKGVGKAPGYVLNQFSIDEWDGHLRVATTVRSTFKCVKESKPPRPPPGRENRPPFVEIPTTWCRWLQVQDSDNMITILKIPDSTSKQMEETGSIKGLGLPGERIYSVRFMEEKAFMVTFRRTDPFYTFDLTDHQNPVMKGELKISGFSNYLHPFDSDGNIMIAVGQNANETTGRTTGLQISLYNVTDLANATAIDRYDVQQGNSRYSWSEAQYNHKAFRFYERSNKLIIPASVAGKDLRSSFNGFKVFSVSLSGISFHFDIQHNIEYTCWSDAYFPARSLIHSGILTTIKGHTVKAHDIETKGFHWLINVDSNNTSC